MPEASDSRDFSTVMADLGMLPAASAADLHRESAEMQVSPTRLALERGLLTADQVEIADALLAPHTAIPGYELLSLLGQGGMGAVFRARQKSLNRIVALKTVLLSRVVGANAVARFEQEAITLARLVHPHIVSAFDFGKSGAKIFLVLEYVEGEDAENFARRRGPLPEAFAWQIVRQAAAGLAHAAALGIVHRDIKPANLLLVEPPAGFPLPKGVPLVKIADFGLALLVSEGEAETRLTSANTALGSPNYMAPEQITGDDVDQRSDIYALGATAYHFLAGEAPFAGQKLQAILGQKLAGRLRPLTELRPDLSPESAALVARMMAIRPNDRPANYAEVLEALEAWTGQSIGARAVDFGRQEALASDQTLEMPATKVNLEATIAEGKGESLSSQKLARRGMIVGGGVLTAVAAFSIFGWRAWQASRRSPSLPSVQYDPARYSPEYSLFSGDSVAGFSDLNGEWRPTLDREGGMVLAGKHGGATRFFRKDALGGNEPEQFRVTIIVQPNESSAHVEFSWDSAARKFRHHLTFSKSGVQAEYAPQQIRNKLSPFPLDPDQNEVELQLVRFADRWWAVVNGEGYASAEAFAGDADRLRLAVDSGPAYFSDFSIAPWQAP